MRGGCAAPARPQYAAGGRTVRGRRIVPQNIPFWPIATLMLLTGVGIPILATFNSALGQQLASPTAASFILFLVGFLLAAIVMLASGGLPDIGRFTIDRPYIYFGAIFMFAYLLSITWAAPRIGIGNAVFFVLLGQLISAAIID